MPSMATPPCLLALFLVCGTAVHQAYAGDDPNLFYLAANEVTVLCPDAEVGDSGEVNGIVYTKREKEEINSTNADSTCTSEITDMSELFAGTAVDPSPFDEDISTWDTSQVTDMASMFRFADNFGFRV